MVDLFIPIFEVGLQDVVMDHRKNIRHDVIDSQGKHLASIVVVEDIRCQHVDPADVPERGLSQGYHHNPCLGLKVHFIERSLL